MTNQSLNAVILDNAILMNQPRATCIGGSRGGGGYGGCNPPFKFQKIKESNKTKQ